MSEQFKDSLDRHKKPFIAYLHNDVTCFLCSLCFESILQKMLLKFCIHKLMQKKRWESIQFYPQTWPVDVKLLACAVKLFYTHQASNGLINNPTVLVALLQMNLAVRLMQKLALYVKGIVNCNCRPWNFHQYFILYSWVIFMLLSSDMTSELKKKSLSWYDNVRLFN